LDQSVVHTFLLLCMVMSVPSAGMGVAVRAPVTPCLARVLHVSLGQSRSVP
jgi:hypothetical protein